MVCSWNTLFFFLIFSIAGTDGSNGVAYDAIRAASNGHHFLSVTKQGLSAIVQTEGNDACHVILRGGKSGTNYDVESIKKTAQELAKLKLAPVVMVDCSHGNSCKDHKRQPLVAQALVSFGYFLFSFCIHSCTGGSIRTTKSYWW
jgi:3-deoxy-7-phosphoheptulonate synthase